MLPVRPARHPGDRLASSPPTRMRRSRWSPAPGRCRSTARTAISADIRKEAALLQKIETGHLEVLRSAWAKARVRIWTMADFVEAPMEPLQAMIDEIGLRQRSRLTEAPKLVDLSGFGQFLQNLRNQGMQPHLMGDFPVNPTTAARNPRRGRGPMWCAEGMAFDYFVILAGMRTGSEVPRSQPQRISRADLPRRAVQPAFHRPAGSTSSCSAVSMEARDADPMALIPRLRQADQGAGRVPAVPRPRSAGRRSGAGRSRGRPRSCCRAIRSTATSR